MAYCKLWGMGRWSLVLGGIVLVGLAGCGKKNDLVSVSGTVLLGDQPLAGATVTFHPVKGGPVGSAITDSAGRFSVMTGTAKGLKPGEYEVTVQKTGQAPKTDPLGPEVPPPLVTPAKYANPKTSGLRYTAPGGPADFKLQSSPTG